MTGFIEQGQLLAPLSRLTIAGLEDLGYTVDYSTADAFGVGDLNLAVCPLCSLPRQLRSVGSRQLGVDEGLAKPRKLKDSVRMEAVQYGLALLQEEKQQVSTIGPDIAANDKWISVVVEDPEEEGGVYSVIVVAGDD